MTSLGKQALLKDRASFQITLRCLHIYNAKKCQQFNNDHSKVTSTQPHSQGHKVDFTKDKINTL